MVYCHDSGGKLRAASPFNKLNCSQHHRAMHRSHHGCHFCQDTLFHNHKYLFTQKQKEMKRSPSCCQRIIRLIHRCRQVHQITFTLTRYTFLRAGTEGSFPAHHARSDVRSLYSYYISNSLSARRVLQGSHNGAWLPEILTLLPFFTHNSVGLPS